MLLRWTLLLLLLVALTTRWSLIPSHWLLVVSAILWITSTTLIFGYKHLISLLPIVTILVAVSIPYKWLAIPSLPILTQFAIATGLITLLFLFASLISRRYDT